MKEFDLELAKQGHPVCTRDGRHARIICFNCKTPNYPIVALVEQTDDTGLFYEETAIYSEKGKFLVDSEVSNCCDLVMVSQKHEGWINLFKNKDSIKPFVGHKIFNSKKEAKNTNVCTDIDTKYIATIKIEWEE